MKLIGLNGLTEDHQQLVSACLDQSRRFVENGEELQPVAFVQKGENELLIIQLQFTDLASKRATYAKLQEIAGEVGAKLAFTVFESWVVRADKGNFKGKSLNEIEKETPPPSEHPERQEAVVVNVETPESSWMGLADIIEIRGVRTFAEIEFTPNPHLEGPMARILPRTVRN